MATVTRSSPSDVFLERAVLKNKESKKNLFWIYLSVKLAGGRLSIKKENSYSFSSCNVASLNNNG